MPEILLGQERIHKEGVDKGIILGRKKGVDEGIILGRENLILEMLKSGKMTDNMICDITEISKTELAKLKIKVEN